MCLLHRSLDRSHYYSHSPRQITLCGGTVDELPALACVRSLFHQMEVPIDVQFSKRVGYLVPSSPHCEEESLGDLSVNKELGQICDLLLLAEHLGGRQASHVLFA